MENPESKRFKMRPRPRRVPREAGRQVRAACARFPLGLRRRRGARPLPPPRVPFIGFSPSLLQQSVVNVRWVQNRGGSGWRAHGRYLAREGAQQEGKPGRGFDAYEEEIDIADRLGGWQRAGDPRLWKIIVSPEAGERLDLRQHARELVTTMEGDLGLRLEWVGIAHFDTAHPHLHVVIRGRSQEGIEFRLPREYVGHGLRLRSQELATQTLGFVGSSATSSPLGSARSRHAATEISTRCSRAGRILNGESSSSPRSRARRMPARCASSSCGDSTSCPTSASHGASENAPSSSPNTTVQRLSGSSLRATSGRASRGTASFWWIPMHRCTSPSSSRVSSSAGAWSAERRTRRGGSLLVLESADGIVHLVPQTPEIEEHRDRDEVIRGEIVTLRAVHAPPGNERTVLVEVTRHGRLHELEAPPSRRPSLTSWPCKPCASTMELSRWMDLSSASERSCGRPSQAGFPFWKSADFCRSRRKSEAASASVAWLWPSMRKRGSSEP